jgi:hypothetical protein
MVKKNILVTLEAFLARQVQVLQTPDVDIRKPNNQQGTLSVLVVDFCIPSEHNFIFNRGNLTKGNGREEVKTELEADFMPLDQNGPIFPDFVEEVPKNQHDCALNHVHEDHEHVIDPLQVWRQLESRVVQV